MLPGDLIDWQTVSVKQQPRIVLFAEATGSRDDAARVLTPLCSVLWVLNAYERVNVSDLR